jgi:DNA-binding response OmpR family regulator/tetratricopeptide (TPR) repeat protein
MSRQRALIVVDEVDVRARIARALQSIGWSVELIEDEKRALQLASKERFSLGIVSAGTAARVSSIEDLHQRIPKILVLTERDDDIAHLRSRLPRLDGFLLNSSTNEDLLNRLGHLTIDTPLAVAPLCLENCWLDLRAQVFINADGREIRLTRSETALLKELARNLGEVRSRDELRHGVVGRGADPFDRSIDMLIARVRRKIEPNPKIPRFIVTVAGSGYKLLATRGSIVKQTGTLPTTAERRQLTISCKIAGWTTLALHCDPEDLMNLSRDFQDAVADVISSFGGTIFARKADSILACFGYPNSTEHDPDSAVQAGLALVRKIGGLQTTMGTPGQVTVGIATGFAVVSALETVGEPVAVATALRDAAAPNSVIIAASTRKLLREEFAFESMQSYRIPETDTSLTACQVLAEGPIKHGFNASHQLKELVGRDRELQQLAKAWDEAKSGQGRVVVLVGDPGIGKSHLCETFIDRISQEPHALIRYECSPYRSNTPFYPVVRQLEQAIGVEHSDTPETKLEKLKSALTHAIGRTQNEVSLYAFLLSINTPQQPPPKSTPKRNKDRLIATLTRHLLQIAARQPLVILFTDAHWADSSTLELMDKFIPSLKGDHVLLLIQCRPQFSSGWMKMAHVTTMQIERLNRTEALALISQMACGKDLSRGIQEQIVSKTDGVPLFIEELTKSALESALGIDLNRRCIAGATETTLRIPTTLLGSLTARLDRLGPAKEVAQMAAATGRECHYELIRLVAGLPEQVLDEALEKLVRSGLMYCEGERPNAVYTFKHALVQDAAYSSLLKGRRVRLHQIIAEVLAQHFPDTLQSEPEIIAFHCSQAGKHEQSANYWLQAARDAAVRSAHKEAVGHLNQGLREVSSINDPVVRNKAELLLQTSLGHSLRAIEGWSTEGVKAAYTRAAELCKERGLDEYAFPALFGLWAWNFLRPPLGEAQFLAERLVQLADHAAERTYEVLSQQALGFTLFAQGKFKAAHAELECSIRRCEDREAAKYLELSAQDPRVHARLYDAMTLWFLGNPDEALRRCTEARYYADASREPFSQAMARTIALRVHQLRGDADLVRSEANAAIAICRDHGFVHYLAMALVLRGWAKAQTGDLEQGIAEIREGFEQERGTGASLYESYTFALMADPCIKHGQYERALDFLRQTQSRMDEENFESFYNAEICRLFGEAYLRSEQELDQAEHWFSESLKIAQEQNSKSLEQKVLANIRELGELKKIGKNAEA